MKPDFNITHIIPNVDLKVWERCLNEADNLADLTQKETAIFIDLQSKPLELRIGLSAKRPVGWKVVYTAKPGRRGCLLPILCLCLGLAVPWAIIAILN